MFGRPSERGVACPALRLQSNKVEDSLSGRTSASRSWRSKLSGIRCRGPTRALQIFFFSFFAGGLLRHILLGCCFISLPQRGASAHENKAWTGWHITLELCGAPKRRIWHAVFWRNNRLSTFRFFSSPELRTLQRAHATTRDTAQHRQVIKLAAHQKSVNESEARAGRLHSVHPSRICDPSANQNAVCLAAFTVCHFIPCREFARFLLSVSSILEWIRYQVIFKPLQNALHGTRRTHTHKKNLTPS